LASRLFVRVLVRDTEPYDDGGRGGGEGFIQRFTRAVNSHHGAEVARLEELEEFSERLGRRPEPLRLEEGEHIRRPGAGPSEAQLPHVAKGPLLVHALEHELDGGREELFVRSQVRDDEAVERDQGIVRTLRRQGLDFHLI